ncbi:SMI1/KNR4 family protein [Microbacterium sp. P07]|uniref:SMI1/KNR4 family protein n=1 Tax=Microbacterium sp. P07 TaxID=3366952 RepID=UPI0037470836
MAAFPELCARLGALDSRLLVVLNPPATPQQIEAVEAEIGQRFPDDLRAAYLHGDGQPAHSSGLIGGLFWLTLAHSLGEWRVWREVVAEHGQIARHASFEPGMIREAYFEPGWWPIASDGGGNHIAVDLTPGPSGTRGQVISCGRDEDYMHVYATSFEDFLGRVIRVAQKRGVDLHDEHPWWAPMDSWGWPIADDYRAAGGAAEAEDPAEWFAGLEPAWQRIVGGEDRAAAFLAKEQYFLSSIKPGEGELRQAWWDATTLEPLSHMRNLRSLVLGLPVFWHFGVFPVLPGLRKLSIGVESSRGLERFPALTSLFIRTRSLDDIAQAPGLTSLGVTGIDDPRWLADIAALPALEELTLSPEGPMLRVHELDWSGFTNLRALTLKASEATDLEWTGALTNLTKFEISLDGDAPVDVTPLARLKNLEELSLEGDAPVVGIEALVANPRLSALTSTFAVARTLRSLRLDRPLKITVRGGMTPDEKSEWKQWHAT